MVMVSEQVRRVLFAPGRISRTTGNYVEVTTLITGMARKRARNAEVTWPTVLPLISALECLRVGDMGITNASRATPRMQHSLLLRILRPHPMKEGGDDVVVENHMQLIAVLWWRTMNRLPVFVDKLDRLDSFKANMSLDVLGSFNRLEINVNDVQDAGRWRADVGKLVRLVHTVVTQTRVAETNHDAITARSTHAASTNGTLPTRLSEDTNELGAAPVTQGPPPVGTIQVIVTQPSTTPAGTYEE